jgi:hypothetical protein
MTEQDIQDLYTLVRGTPFANTLLEAASAFGQGDGSAALQLVQDVRDGYAKSRTRTLRADPDKSGAGEKEIARLKSKQKKYNDVLAKFDEALAALDRQVKLNPPKSPRPRPSSVSLSASSRESPQLTEQFNTDYEAAQTRADQLQVVRRHFDMERINPEHEISNNLLYYLRDTEQDYVIRVSTKDPNSDQVSIASAITGEQLTSLTKVKFRKLGENRRLVQLRARVPATEQSESNVPTGGDDRDPGDRPAEKASSEDQPDRVLDMGAFTQLMDAAQRSGLVPGADLIARARDREFRMRKYRETSQIIEGMFSKFIAAATQRTQRLRREEMDIASGKLKMSPRDLLAKRARDTAETQNIDRARSRFMRVLEGLRVLMRV